MHLRYLIPLLLFLGLIAVSAATKNSLQEPSQTLDARKKPPDPTSLRARVRKEKAKGIQQVTFSGPIVEYAEGITLNDALADTTVVIADVTEKYSRLIDSHTVGTFYKLTIIEILSKPSSSGCCGPNDEDLPKDLPALEKNEVYLLGMGGTVIIDDVQVTVTEDFNELLPYRRYLFFISPSASGKLYLNRIGPRGIFTVEPGGYLESLGDRPLKLARELSQRYSNSLSRMRADVRRKK